MQTKTETVDLGFCYVDAGLIWIGDPCYIMGDDASSRVTSWSDFCDKLHHGVRKGDKELKDIVSSTPLGEGTGIAVSSGFGDGTYRVTAEVSDEGSWGMRVKSVTITFIEDEEWD